jgi:HK97 family phage prohead protease
MPAPIVSEKFERRVFSVGKLEARKLEGEKRSLAGHAAVFNQRTDLGYFAEIVAPGAFAKSIGADDIRALFNHDPNFVLGRNKAGTLKLSEDTQGLAVEIDPPDTQFARDLAVSIERGDVTQMSFGFETVADEWFKDANGDWTRTLREVKLWDVSPVTFPAYPQTDIAARSLEAAKARLIVPVSAIDLRKRRQQLLEVEG